MADETGPPPGETAYGIPIHHTKRGVQYVNPNEMAQSEHIRELFRKAAKAFEHMGPQEVTKEDN